MSKTSLSRTVALCPAVSSSSFRFGVSCCGARSGRSCSSSLRRSGVKVEPLCRGGDLLLLAERAMPDLVYVIITRVVIVRKKGKITFVYFVVLEK